MPPGTDESVAMRHRLELSVDYVELEWIRRAASGRTEITLRPEVWRSIEDGAAQARALAQGHDVVYGVNTGFGALCRERIEPSDISRLQHNHLLSHACGVGPPVDDAIVRLMIVIKLLTFRMGHSGVGRSAVERLLLFLNSGVLPVVPRQGSVGASGDLAPLAHLALPLIGEGFVRSDGAIQPAAAVLAERGWSPLTLGPKEGLALTNGVQFMNACAVHALTRAARLIGCADLVASLSIQGFSAASAWYDPRLRRTTAHPERWAVLTCLNRLLHGSNHASLPWCDPAKEDPYSFRCIPQIHAAARQAARFCAEIVERDCNSASDNPLFFPGEGIHLTNGSMHGQTTALALDVLAIALADLSSVSERRTYQLLSGQRGLPSFLATEPGVDSGLMVWQYTAAALVNESKILAAPASVDTIMTCQLQEDHVSMGATSALKIDKILENLEHILAIETIAAAAAIDFNTPLSVSPMTARVYGALREEIAPIRGDRLMTQDVERACHFLRQSPVVTEILASVGHNPTTRAPSS